MMPGGDWTDVLHQKIDRLEAELAAEVSVAVEALAKLMADVNMDSVRTFAKPGHQFSLPVSLETIESVNSALTTLQSSDALAEIRRAVARECEGVMLDCLLRMPRSERTTKFASAVADAIRAKFNLAP